MIELKVTEDGSTTLFVKELNEHYHSIHGAIQESMHVFIEAGLKQIDKKDIRIFEMGLGTGLNCLLSMIQTTNQSVFYHAVEENPLPYSISEKLNYCESLNLEPDIIQQFYELHHSDWDTDVTLRTGYILKKERVDILQFTTKQKFDLIYFDAFSPEVQPSLWSSDVFQNMYNILDNNGILVTYCAKGSVRRTMKSCGFLVERIPGPPGKREMLRAIKEQ